MSNYWGFRKKSKNFSTIISSNYLYIVNISSLLHVSCRSAEMSVGLYFSTDLSNFGIFKIKMWWLQTAKSRATLRIK